MLRTKRKPFHESILDVIPLASKEELECLARLIRRTEIPKGHDEIIKVWKLRSAKPDYLGIIKNLRLQKRAAKRKADKKAKTAAAAI